MAAPLAPEHFAAWQAFISAYWRLAGPVEKAIADAGLPPVPWYDVLSALDAAPGRTLRMSDLAGRVLLSRSGLTRLVDQLEKDGLLKRGACRDDGRGFEAELTARGRETLRRFQPVYRRSIADYFARKLTITQAVQLAGLMSRLLDEQPPTAATARKPKAVRASPAIVIVPPRSAPAPTLAWQDFDPVAD